MLYFVDTNNTNIENDCYLLTIGVVSEDAKASFYGEVRGNTSMICDSLVKEGKVIPKLKEGELLIADGLHVRISSSYATVAYAFVNWLWSLLNTKEDSPSDCEPIIFASKISYENALLVYQLIKDGTNLITNRDISELIWNNINPAFIDIFTLLCQKVCKCSIPIEESSHTMYCAKIIDLLDGGFVPENSDITEDLLRDYEKKNDSFWIASLCRLLYYNLTQDKWPLVRFPDVKKVLKYWVDVPSSRFQDISFSNIDDCFSTNVKVFPSTPDVLTSKTRLRLEEKCK